MFQSAEFACVESTPAPVLETVSQSWQVQGPSPSSRVPWLVTMLIQPWGDRHTYVPRLGLRTCQPPTVLARCSDLASGVTGEIMYVDGGFNPPALGNAEPLGQ